MQLSASAGGGGPAASSSNAGVSVPINTPFNFDGSGWVINFGDGNTAAATGNKDANQASQTPSGGVAGLLAGLGLTPQMLLIAAAAYLVWKR